MTRLSPIVLGLIGLCACAGSDVPVAPVKSPHFDAVSERLQLGGTVYAYVDIDGDAERAADFVLSLLRDLPELLPQQSTHRLNATSLVRVLGLDAVRAVGLSSYERGDLYHNRTFIHHTGSRRGLLRALGGEPAPFAMASLAPEDADLVWEQQVDVASLVEMVREIGELGVGLSPEELDAELRRPVLGLGVSWGALLENLRATVGVVLSLDEGRNLWIPGESFTFAYTDFVLRVDGLAPLADAIIERAASEPFLRSRSNDGWVIVSPAIRLPPPWNAYEPALMKEQATGRLYVVSSPAFMERCLATAETGNIASNVVFQTAFADLPRSGNGMTFLSPTMTRQMHAALDQVIAAQGGTITTTVARVLLPDAGTPVGWALRNEPNGMLFTSNTASSHKSTLLTMGLAALLPAAVIVGASWMAAEPAPDVPNVEPPFWP